MISRRYKPVDCTTNPSLVLKAVQNPQYHHYLKKAMASEPDPSDSQNSDRSHSLHGPASYAAISITAKLTFVVCWPDLGLE